MSSNYSRDAAPAKRSKRLRNPNFESLCEDLIHIILSRLPLHKIFQVQSVCHLWRSIICSSQHFHRLWEERNSEQWLIMDTKDGNVAMFNRSAQFKKKIFDSTCWHLLAASGGFLLYRNRGDGMLHVVNPLTMQSRQLPDPLLGHEHLSTYLKSEKDSHNIAINLSVDSIARTYQVILMANLYEIGDLLIYRSAELSWESKVVENNFVGLEIGKWFPYKTASNQTIYCFPFHQDFETTSYVNYNPVFSYNLSGKLSGKISLAKDLCDRDVDSCDCVFFQGKTIKRALWRPPVGRIVVIIYELDEASCQWNIISLCRWNDVSELDLARIEFDELLCEKDFVLRCGGGDRDYVWIMPSATDKGAQKMQQEDNLHFNGHNHENSKAFPMQLRFWPCS